MCSTSKQMTISSEAKQIIVIDEFNLKWKYGLSGSQKEAGWIGIWKK